MGFLEKLGNLGIGRTDNRAAGSASGLADALRGAVASQTGRDKKGMEQEMLAYTQEGQEISMEQMKQLAQKYDQPMGEVFQTTTAMNNRVQSENMKKLNTKYMSWVAANKSKNGSMWKPKEQELRGWMSENIKDMQTAAKFMEIREKAYPEAQKKITTLSPGAQAYDDNGALIAENTSMGASGGPTGLIKQFIDTKGVAPKNTAELKAFQTEIRPDPQPTETERDKKELKSQVIKLRETAKKDPNKVYAAGYRMNEDGTPYVNPIDGHPEKLPPFQKVMGKRGNISMALAAGEFWDDAKQLNTLLRDPEVMEALGAAEDAGLWDMTTGKWSNKIKLWMAKKGIGKESKVGETIVRMQMMASEERKKFLGAAVTDTELESVKGWMPDTGDSFDTILNKINVAVFEGEEKFIRIIDTFKDNCNMTPFYKAFKINRFGERPKHSPIPDRKAKQEISTGKVGKDPSQMTDQELLDALNG